MSKLPIAPSVWIILGPVLFLGALSVLLPLLLPTDRRTPDAGRRGLFYNNPNDPALFVPKRFGIGYTLNFGNRWCWAVLTLILLMVTLPVILSTILTMRHLPR